MMIACHCGHEFEAEIPEKVDLDADPEIEGRILDGSFHEIECPHCGGDLKPELRTEFSSAERSLSVVMAPEMRRPSVLAGTFAVGDDQEVVVGFQELTERLRIARSGLRRDVVELLKESLARKVGKSDEIQVYFESADSGDLVFHVTGVKAGEVAVAKFPLARYREVEGHPENYPLLEELQNVTYPSYRILG